MQRRLRIADQAIGAQHQRRIVSDLGLIVVAGVVSFAQLGAGHLLGLGQAIEIPHQTLELSHNQITSAKPAAL